jgi:hypothetical protein
MERNGMVKIVWDEGGTCHAIRGRVLPEEDDLFLVLQLIDGTELRIAKSRIVKIERPPEGPL